MITAFDPLKRPAFRRIWISSLFCNASQQIQVVTVGWILVQLAATPQQVALIQTASMLPVMLLSIPAGAIADNYNRRNAAIVALCIALCGALLMSILAGTHALSTALILLCCSIVGTGLSFFTPAWQASVVDLVGTHSLPAAVSLNALANNMARSVGPVVGGTMLLALGAPLTLTLNTFLYVPMLIALWMWKQPAVSRPSRPERLLRATVSGFRYVYLTPSIRWLLLRSAVAAIGTSAVLSLLPLLVRNELQGDAITYGLLLGAFGLGAVSAALFASALRKRVSPEHAVRYHLAAQGLAAIVLAIFHLPVIAAAALVVVGACWVTNNAAFNVSIQLSAPRWIGARLLAFFYASTAGGLAIGAWIWGHVAAATSVSHSMLIAGGLLLTSPLLGVFGKLKTAVGDKVMSVPSRNALEVALQLEGRSGPITLEISYRISEGRASEFCALMTELQRCRQRNGAGQVQLARDIADPELWTELAQYRTWDDYTRARSRPTQPERELQSRVNALHHGREQIKTRRLLAAEPAVRRSDGADIF